MKEVSKKLNMESSPDVHHAVEHLTETLTSAMNSHVPQTRKRAPGQPKWWNEDLHKMRCEVQKLRRRTWKAKADHSYARWRNMYKTASRKYASAVRIAKSRSWKGFIESHTAFYAWGMPYKILSGKMKTKSVLSTLQVNPHEFTTGTLLYFLSRSLRLLSATQLSE